MPTIYASEVVTETLINTDLTGIQSAEVAVETLINTDVTGIQSAEVAVETLINTDVTGVQSAAVAVEFLVPVTVSVSATIAISQPLSMSFTLIPPVGYVYSTPQSATPYRKQEWEGRHGHEVFDCRGEHQAIIDVLEKFPDTKTWTGQTI